MCVLFVRMILPLSGCCGLSKLFSCFTTRNTAIRIRNTLHRPRDLRRAVRIRSVCRSFSLQCNETSRFSDPPCSAARHRLRNCSALRHHSRCCSLRHRSWSCSLRHRSRSSFLAASFADHRVRFSLSGKAQPSFCCCGVCADVLPFERHSIEQFSSSV